MFSINVWKTRHYTSDRGGQPTANSKSLVLRGQCFPLSVRPSIHFFVRSPTTPGGSHMTASLGGRYDPWPVKRSTVCYQIMNTIFWKRMILCWCKMAQLVREARASSFLHSFFPWGTDSISCQVMRPPNGPNARPRTIYTMHKGNSENSLELNTN